MIEESDDDPPKAERDGDELQDRELFQGAENSAGNGASEKSMRSFAILF